MRSRSALPLVKRMWRGDLSCCKGLWVNIEVMENQMEKKVESDMETGVGLYWGYIIFIQIFPLVMPHSYGTGGPSCVNKRSSGKPLEISGMPTP